MANCHFAAGHKIKTADDLQEQPEGGHDNASYYERSSLISYVNVQYFAWSMLIRAFHFIKFWFNFCPLLFLQVMIPHDLPCPNALYWNACSFPI